MDEEQRHDTKLRQASRAGLVAAVFMILMVGAAVFALVNLWPLFAAVPVSQAETVTPVGP